MANAREIQSRIKSVQDTMKITNAMYMISSSKMKKAKKVLYEEGESVVLEAIKAYKAEIQENGTEEKYILHGSTFFNGRWRDYIKEHKSKPVPEKPSEEPEQPIDYSNVERKW